MRKNLCMTSDRRQGRSHHGVPKGDPLIEVTIRIFPGPGADDPSYPPRGGPFSGDTIEWSYPEHLHNRALDRVAVIRHAVSVLLDNLDGSATIDVQ
jgi:hypothetical protein